jgi:hypothetical protein
LQVNTICGLLALGFTPEGIHSYLGGTRQLIDKISVSFNLGKAKSAASKTVNMSPYANKNLSDQDLAEMFGAASNLSNKIGE